MIKNKNILIVGSSGIVGDTLMNKLISLGNNVLVTSRNTNRVKKLNRKFHDLKSSSKAFQLDLTKEKHIDKFIADIKKKKLKVHGYVHNANSVLEYASIGKIPWDYWKKGSLVSLASFEKISSSLVSNISISRIESIVTISSIYAVRNPKFDIYKKKNNPNPIYYGAMKAALLNVSSYLAAFWGKRDVRVNSISPGGIKNNQSKDFLNSYNKTVPTGRMVTSSEVIEATIFLLSKHSSGINGANIVVDAGKTIW